MKLNYWPPALIRYTDDLLEGVGGQANGPYVRIRPAYRDDVGLLAHELCHVWQFWLTLGTHSLLYLLARPYRQWAEVMAYRAQMRYPNRHSIDLSLDDAAYKLAGPRYDLQLTLSEARELLRG
jgi:hypothetical protein